jgi:hypothetical protein
MPHIRNKGTTLMGNEERKWLLNARCNKYATTMLATIGKGRGPADYMLMLEAGPRPT